MAARTNEIFPVGARVVHGDHGACEIVEHLVVTERPHPTQPRLRSNEWRPCAPGEAPTHYTLKAHRGPLMVEVGAIDRSIVDDLTARGLVDRLLVGLPDPLDRLVAEGLLVPDPPPRGARAHDINRAMSLLDGVRVLRSYYAQPPGWLGQGAVQWLTSFERLVLGELAMALEVPFEELRTSIHQAHAGPRAYDAEVEARAEARKLAIEREKKRKKKPYPLPLRRLTSPSRRGPPSRKGAAPRRAARGGRATGR